MPLALPTLASEVPGNLVTSALWNANVYNGLTYAYNPPIFMGYQTATQSIPNGGSATAIAVDTTLVDSYGGHSNVTNNSRYVAQQSGYYLVASTVGYAANATGNRVAQINKNGTVVTLGVCAAIAPTTSNGGTVQVSAIVQMNGTGDYVEAYAFQTSGGALSTNGSTTGLIVIWLHA